MTAAGADAGGADGKCLQGLGFLSGALFVRGGLVGDGDRVECGDGDAFCAIWCGVGFVAGGDCAECVEFAGELGNAGAGVGAVVADGVGASDAVVSWGDGGGAAGGGSD